MAQTKKEEIQNKILRSARTVFLKEGFAGANMRTIADLAEVTLSNLYNYYRDKDDLFKSILEPRISDLTQLCEYGKTKFPQETAFESLAEKKKYFLKGVIYIGRHRQDLYLLFNLSRGSKLEFFSDYLVKEYEKTWDHYFITLNEKFPDHTFIKPSSFFLRSMAHFHLAIVRQVLAENLPTNKLTDICEEWVTFIWHGGMSLIHQNAR